MFKRRSWSRVESGFSAMRPNHEPTSEIPDFKSCDRTGQIHGVVCLCLIELDAVLPAPSLITARRNLLST